MHLWRTASPGIKRYNYTRAEASILLTCLHVWTQAVSVVCSTVTYFLVSPNKICIYSLCVFSVQTLDSCEILLGPEVTYGPPGLDLFCPVAMTIAHCAEVDAENWNIQLKRRTQDSKWEVRAAGRMSFKHSAAHCNVTWAIGNMQRAIPLPINRILLKTVAVYKM